MATEKLTTDSGWLASKCRKHTTKETIDWVTETWSKTVRPEFVKFFNSIQDSTAPVPMSFFEVAGITHGNSNPLFTFFRPKKQLYISYALTSSRSAKVVANVRGVLMEYLGEWEKCLMALQNRYPENSSINKCRHLIERATEFTNTFREGCSEPIDEDRYSKYKDFYGQACAAFNAIPCKIANSKMTQDAVKEALKQSAAVKKPVHRKKRRLSERQAADKPRIATIVKQIKRLTNPAPGQPRRSVLKALRVLKFREVYGPIIKELNLSDNTWKKYVQNSKKSGV